MNLVSSGYMEKALGPAGPGEREAAQQDDDHKWQGGGARAALPNRENVSHVGDFKFSSSHI